MPRFPTGLPSWGQAWLSVAFDAASATYLLVWRQRHAPARVLLALPHLAEAELAVEQIYPPTDRLPQWGVRRTETGVELEVPDLAPAARMYRVSR